jgi:hypothetical protein
LINDVPDGPRDRRTHGPRTAAPLVAALATAFIAAAIAGCGGGESSTSTSASVTTTPGAPSHTTSTSTNPGSTGGNKGPRPGQHNPTPKDSVTAVLTRVTPRDCLAGMTRATNVTAHFVHAAYGDVQGCIHALNQGAVAKSLGSYSEKVAGNTATVEVRPVGGIYDGEKLTVSLVKEDGSWKVDSMKSNAPVGP